MEQPQLLQQLSPVLVEQTYRFEKEFEIHIPAIGEDETEYHQKKIKVLLHVLCESAEFFIEMDDIFNAENRLVSLRGTNVIGNTAFNAQAFFRMLAWLQEIVYFAECKLGIFGATKYDSYKDQAVEAIAIEFADYCDNMAYPTNAYKEYHLTPEDFKKFYSDFWVHKSRSQKLRFKKK